MLRIELIPEIPYNILPRLFDTWIAEVEKGKELVVLTSHPPVITLGTRAESHEVLINRWERLRRDIALYYTDRGGGATYHGPCQEILYPVFSLARHGLDVSSYIRLLADAVIEVLREQGIEGAFDERRPGVYVDGRKLASIGLRISKGIVYHGLSFNIHSCTEGFSLIHPCKEPGLEVVSIEELLGEVPERWSTGVKVAESLIQNL